MRGNPAFTVSVFDPNDIVQIVLSCDVGNAILAPFNNQANVTVPAVITTPINSNIVSATILDIALQKYQATGWDSVVDPF